MDAKTDVFGKITERIVSILEAGKASGSITWSGQGEADRIPYNLSTGKQYRGANVLSLWGSALEAGFTPCSSTGWAKSATAVSSSNATGPAASTW